MLTYIFPIFFCLLYILLSPHSPQLPQSPIETTTMVSLIRDQTPGCYMNAVSELFAEKIQLGEFFKRCLAHFGPAEQRVHHLPDDSLASDFVRPLIWNGKRFGPMASAIKICETDPRIASYPGDKLELFFSACASGQADMASLRSGSSTVSAPDAYRLMTLPLFRQAMFFTALSTGNPALAIQIVDEKPLKYLPPPEKWLLGEHVKAFYHPDEDQEKIPLRVWAAVLRNKWTPIDKMLLFDAARGGNSEESIELLDAIVNVDPNFLFSEDWFQKTAFDFVIQAGTPEVLQHLWKLYKVPEAERLKDDLLIVNTEGNNTGGLTMLGWLLDQGLDVNYRRVTESDEEVPYSGDPRETAERWYAHQLAPLSRRKTALHAATSMRNAEAVKYLLSRGANVDAQDGLGQTARFIAERDGHVEVVKVIDEFVKGTG
ncbi:NACHT and ankyrin domain protein [Trichoderma velutinum]